MPDDELLSIQEVTLNTAIEQILSRPGVRVNCEVCGEEVINERDIIYDSHIVCYACAHGGYYRPAEALESADCAQFS